MNMPNLAERIQQTIQQEEAEDKLRREWRGHGNRRVPASWDAMQSRPPSQQPKVLNRLDYMGERRKAKVVSNGTTLEVHAI